MECRVLLAVGFIRSAVLLVIVTGLVHAVNYHIADPRGADGLPDTRDDINSSDNYPGTSALPFATLTKACKVASPGDTVFIKGGVYNQTLRPANSGTQDRVIVYKNLDTGEVVIKNTPGLSNLTPDEVNADQEGRQYGIYLYGLSYITIQGLSVTNVSGWVRVVKSSHITLQRNKFTQALSTGTTGSIKFLFSNRNRVLDNIIHDGNDNLLLIHSDSNLVSGNNMMKGRHSIWCIRAGNFNVIKNNYFHNEIQKIGEIYDAENDSPFVYDATKYNVVEANEFAKTPSSGDASPYAGIQFAGQRCIVRRNLFYETVGPGFDLTLYEDEARYNYENRVYNNVFYKTDFAGVSIAGSTSFTFHDNILKNNIFYKSVFVANDKRWKWYTDELEGKPVQVLTGRKEGFAFENNDFFNQAAGEPYLVTYGDRTSTSNPLQHEIAWWESNSPGLFKGSLEKDPQFVNATDHDFHLQQTSPMIDAGTFLTVTRSAGSGSIVPVADVKYFYSGFGITGEAGDLIQLAGQTQTARIVDIRYDSNYLVLDKNLDWKESQGVSLSYGGNATDLGAFEYGITPVCVPYHSDRFTDKNIFITACYCPSQGRVRITFGLSRATTVQVALFKLNGKQTRRFLLGRRDAGTQTVTLDCPASGGTSFSHGICVVRLNSGDLRSAARVVYLR